MIVLFCYQDVLEVIKNDVNPLVEGAIVEQKTAHKEEKMKYFKVLYHIHQCVDVDNFEKVDDCTSSKKAWGILEKCYEGADKAKAVRL